MVPYQSLVEFPVDYLSYLFVSSLVFFYVNLLHSLTMGLTISFLSLLRIIDFRFNITSPYGIFCAAIWKDSVSLLRFPFFFSYVRVFSYAISHVCSRKYPYSCFLPISISYFVFVFVFFFFLLFFCLCFYYRCYYWRLQLAFLRYFMYFSTAIWIYAILNTD